MRLIDGDDFQKRIEQLCDALCEYSKKERQYMCSACKLGNVLDVIDDAPTVDAVPVRHGRWKWNGEAFICSACGNGHKGQPTIMGQPMFEFCPICGARMDGKDGGND